MEIADESWFGGYRFWMWEAVGSNKLLLATGFLSESKEGKRVNLYDTSMARPRLSLSHTYTWW